MEPIKDTKYNSTVDQIIVEEAAELRTKIQDLKKLTEKYENRLADLEHDDSEIKTIRNAAREKRRELEQVNAPSPDETPIDETPESGEAPEAEPIQEGPEPGSELDPIDQSSK